MSIVQTNNGKKYIGFYLFGIFRAQQRTYPCMINRSRRLVCYVKVADSAYDEVRGAYVSC